MDVSTVGSSDPEAAIREIVTEQMAAWNVGDGEGYGRHMAHDVSFTNLFGMVMYGKDAFIQRHVDILRTFYRGTTKHHEVRRIHLITSEVAIVDIDNEIHGVTTMPRGIDIPEDGIIATQLLEVFASTGGVWLVVAYHNVDVKSGADVAAAAAG